MLAHVVELAAHVSQIVRRNVGSLPRAATGNDHKPHAERRLGRTAAAMTPYERRSARMVHGFMRLGPGPHAPTDTTGWMSPAALASLVAPFATGETPTSPLSPSALT